MANITTKQLYVTTDGKEFASSSDATAHQNILDAVDQVEANIDAYVAAKYENAAAGKRAKSILVDFFAAQAGAAIERVAATVKDVAAAA